MHCQCHVGKVKSS